MERTTAIALLPGIHGRDGRLTVMVSSLSLSLGGACLPDKPYGLKIPATMSPAETHASR